MAENSIMWGGTVTGDAGPYSDDDWSDIWQEFFLYDRTLQGVIRSIDNDLAVTGGTSPLSVNTGRAIVDGKWYENDSALAVAVPTPAVSTRIDRIVLEKDWAAQTVRVTRVAGIEGGGAPALTQTDGTTWQIPLAQATIVTGGTITLVDEREFVFSPLAITTRYVEMVLFDWDVVVETGNGKFYFHVPENLDGMNLVEVHAYVITPGTTGTLDVQIHNLTDAADMLSTLLTIDSTENGSDTAATPAVIDTGNDDISENDIIRIDVDAVQTTEPEGLIVTMGFRLP